LCDKYNRVIGSILGLVLFNHKSNYCIAFNL
jgi:hypothetical protein